MLAAVACVVAGAVLLVWRSYRRAAAVGSPYAPEGRIRWEASDLPGGGRS